MKGILLNVTHQVMYSTGMLQLHLYLKSKGHSISHSDINYDENKFNLVKQEIRNNPSSYQWVGLHADYQTINETSDFVEDLQQWGYGGHISLGGVFPTMYPEHYFNKMAIDSIVLGEGEKVVELLLQKLKSGKDWTTIPGLAWKDNGVIKRNSNTFSPVAWEEIPEDIRLLNVHWKRNAVYIPSSFIRSCKSFCQWCPERFTERAADTPFSRVNSLPIQHKSVGRIKKEIEKIIEKFKTKFNSENYSEENRFISFYLLDNDAFSTQELIERNFELALWFKGDLIPAMKEEQIKVGWFLWGTTRYILSQTDDYLNLLKSSNLTILVGIESFSDSQLKRFGKRTTSLENLEVCKRLGLKAGVLMILWDPFSTPEEILDSWSKYESIHKCPKPPDFELMNKYLVVLPGTPMYKKYMAQNKKYRCDKLGALSHYELLNPVANRLQAVLSQYVHYWIKLRGAQQSLCIDEKYPFYSEFKNIGLDKCTFCEIGNHKESYMSFKNAIIEIIQMGIRGGNNWEEEAIKLSHSEIRKLKSELNEYVFGKKTLYQLALDYQRN